MTHRLRSAITVLVAVATLTTGGDLSAEERRLEFNPRRVLDPQPPIADPAHLAASAVEDEVRPNELVIGVASDGAARAYPLNMLTGPRREVIHDK